MFCLFMAGKGHDSRDSLSEGDGNATYPVMKKEPLWDDNADQAASVPSKYRNECVRCFQTCMCDGCTVYQYSVQCIIFISRKRRYWCRHDASIDRGEEG